jgi:hypothetical protein
MNKMILSISLMFFSQAIEGSLREQMKNSNTMLVQQPTKLNHSTQLYFRTDEAEPQAFRVILESIQPGAMSTAIAEVRDCDGLLKTPSKYGAGSFSFVPNQANGSVNDLARELIQQISSLGVNLEDSDMHLKFHLKLEAINLRYENATLAIYKNEIPYLQDLIGKQSSSGSQDEKTRLLSVQSERPDFTQKLDVTKELETPSVTLWWSSLSKAQQSLIVVGSLGGCAALAALIFHLTGYKF